MSINQDIDDLLQGGAAAYKFETIGDKCVGTVVRADTQQQTDFTTKQPKTFPDGKPMMQIVVTVDQANGDGETALYFKGGNFEVKEGTGKSSLDALREALDDRKLEVGGTLAMQFSGYGKPKTGNPPKLYVCEYKPPALGIDPSVGLI